MSASPPKKWKEKLEPYRHEVGAIVLAVIAHIILYSFLWEFLKEHYGKPLGFLILTSPLLIVLCLFFLLYLTRRLLIKPLKEGMKIALAEALQEYGDKSLRSPQDNLIDKFERMQKKYSWIHFKEARSINEFSVRETNKVKLGLMKGVEKCVYAIHRIETYLPLDAEDETNYFEDNKKALERIRKTYDSPGDSHDHNIHRIFIISKEALEDPSMQGRIRSKIEDHCKAEMDIKVVLKDNLIEVPAFEFAIYDREIALKLVINQHSRSYGEGIIYFNDAVVNDVYQERYKDIEAQSLKAEDFWKKYPTKP